MTSSADPVLAELAMACRILDMDAALVSEVAGGREHVRWAAGEGEWAGVSAALRDTICQRLLDGRVDAVVHDAAAHPAVRDLPAVREGTVRSYVGVPFTTGGARAYVLCCLARERRPDLGEADVRFLRGVAESIRAQLS